MTKAEEMRLVRLRSKLMQAGSGGEWGDVTRACRHFGISRKTFYKWKERYDEHGDAGLADRPRTPLRSPRATPPDVVSKILYLRQNYHFGPRKIADYLKRFHQVSVAGATVHRILLKHGMHRLPANQKYRQHVRRWKRYEKPQPGHRLQMDVKFLERIPGTRKRLYQFTAIDDCTRVRVLKIYDSCTMTTAIRFADEVIRRLPFRVHVIQTDNGAEFQSKFHWHLEQLDIRHVYIKPRTPRLNGKVERSHLTARLRPYRSGAGLHCHGWFALAQVVRRAPPARSKEAFRSDVSLSRRAQILAPTLHSKRPRGRAPRYFCG